jgi:hypothetical protein
VVQCVRRLTSAREFWVRSRSGHNISVIFSKPGCLWLFKITNIHPSITKHLFLYEKARTWLLIILKKKIWQYCQYTIRNLDLIHSILETKSVVYKSPISKNHLVLFWAKVNWICNLVPYSKGHIHLLYTITKLFFYSQGNCWKISSIFKICLIRLVIIFK